MTLTLTLWDSQKASVPSENTWCWQGYEPNSLYTYLESHADRIRNRYLMWIQKLSEVKLRGKAVVDHCTLENEFSYWWMTSFVEKCPWSTNAHTEALRLLALEEIVLSRQYQELVFVGANLRVHEVLKNFCEKINIAYRWRALSDQKPEQYFGRIKKILLPIKAVVWFLRAAWQARFKPVDVKGFSGKNISVFSYFFNLDTRQAEQNRHVSGYWGDLPRLINAMGHHIYWHEFFIPSKVALNLKAARKRVENFNSCDDQNSYLLPELHFSLSHLISAFFKWIKVLQMAVRLRSLRAITIDTVSHLSLLILFQNEWRNSFYGTLAAKNLVWFECLSDILSSVPKQGCGLYLCENQPWERGLIYLWRKNGHGKIFGVPHSTVRFWHLSYFESAEGFRKNSLPQPDALVLNGDMAVTTCLSSGYPEEFCVAGEALRYGYLDAFLNQKISDQNDDAYFKILVLTDYSASVTTAMMSLLTQIPEDIRTKIVFTVKSHPAYPVRAEDYPELNLQIVDDRLEHILHDFKIAFSSNRTSASLDAHLAGLKSVVMLDPTDLNFSPLRGEASASFVTHAGEFCAALERFKNQSYPQNKEVNSQYFYLDSSLSRWQKLLSSCL